MNIILEFGKILLPAALVLYAMYLTMKSVLSRDAMKAGLDYRVETAKAALPNRLQAFERMCLFLERLSIGNLVLRLNENTMTVRQLQQTMITEIREEFNHNMSQQIYMSDNSWNMIRNTVEDVIALINTSAEKLDPNAKSLELAKLLFQQMDARDIDPVLVTLSEVKSEIRTIF